MRDRIHSENTVGFGKQFRKQRARYCYKTGSIEQTIGKHNIKRCGFLKYFIWDGIYFPRIDYNGIDQNFSSIAAQLGLQVIDARIKAVEMVFAAGVGYNNHFRR